MKWEYKRILADGDSTIMDNRNTVKALDEQGCEEFENTLNTLGQEGWELVTAVIIDGVQTSRFYKDRCIIEYIFKRPVA